MIPTSLKNCIYLSALDLTYNQLTGHIPSDLGILRYMSAFLVGANNLTGSFPTFFVNWTQLSLMDITDNHLSGQLNINANIGDLHQLSVLYANGNDFEGPIPDTLGNSSSITQLLLFGNHLSGPIPTSLLNMTSLERLLLQENQLQGQIPVDLLRFGPQFGALDLSHNNLEGNIPLEIGQLSGLANLNLSSNNFIGIVPSSLENCSKMSKLDLSSNKLEGSLPMIIASTMSTSLIYLSLAHNSFSGSWPLEFSKLINAQTINVAANNLSGSIPLGLKNCLSLEHFDISFNHFSGEIPQDLGLLSNLQFFNASFNDFEGPIPQSGFFNSNHINENAFLGNPGLCGPIALIGPNHQACPVAPKNVTNPGGCEGFKCKRVWIPVVLVLALISLAVVLIVIGIKLRSTFYRGWRDDKFDEHLMVNFSPHLKLTEKDVLLAISDDNIIGAGNKTAVYKGIHPKGVEFALKKLILNVDDHEQEIDSTFKDVGDGANNLRESELAKEAKILAQFRHRNILKCLSLYSSLDLMALVLEYMSSGSLHKHLYEMEECSLTWQTRLKIAIGVAQGLVYLHHEFPEPIIHRDLKPSNILLDANFEPKVVDFGISKFVNPLRDVEATASTVCGTIGYMPPEYSSTLRVSTKGDVYSYGMILLELLTQRQPSSIDDLGDQGTDLKTWVLKNFQERPFQLLDSSLARECSVDNDAMEQIRLLFRVGLFCTRVPPQSRPSMINVVGMLKDIVDFGVEPVPRRTVEEMAAHDTGPTTWANEDPTMEGVEFGSSC